MGITVRRAALLGLVLLAGCFAKLESAPGSDDGDDLPGDTSVDPPLLDADPGAEPDAAPALPDAPTCSERQVVLLFDGVQLTRGPSNAAARTASWVGEANGATVATIPAYRAGDPNRAAVIAQITDRVRAKLAQFPITVATTAPATGDYVLVALGGTAQQSGSAYGIARNVLDCGNAAPNDVSWIADATAVDQVDDVVMGAIGYGLGLGGTNDPGNCMCSWRNECQRQGDCSLATSITAVNDVCAQTPNPQNQVAAFDAGFCQ